MHAFTALTFLGFLTTFINAIVITTPDQMRTSTENVAAYIGVSGVNLGCAISDDNFRAKSEISSVTGVENCWSWSVSVTDLEVTWGDFDWISLYRGSNCSSSDKVTFTKTDVELVDGQSCHATDVVRGQEYVNILESGSLLFGTGIVPTDVIFTLPKITPSVDSVANKLKMLRNGELKAPY